jgi:hypothetical protein
MSGLQRAATRVRYLIGAAVGASLMVSQVHPDAIGAQAIHGRLVLMDPLPPDVCVRPAAVQWAEQAGRQGRRASTQPLDAQTKIFAGPPARKVQDRYAAFAAVSVDPVRDEVILTDENLFQVLAYNRLDNGGFTFTTRRRLNLQIHRLVRTTADRSVEAPSLAPHPRLGRLRPGRDRGEGGSEVLPVQSRRRSRSVREPVQRDVIGDVIPR